MAEAITAQEMQQLERYTIDEIGVSPLVLMERTAMSVIEVLGAGDFDLSNVLVLCGLGNNGGDGIAIARLLIQKGINVDLLILGDEKRASPRTLSQLNIARKYGIEVKQRASDFRSYTAIVDALFGIGLSKPVPAKLGDVIKRINSANVPVVSVDTPSGLDATTGEILGSSIRAAATVTFGYAKTGLLQNEGLKRAGNIYVKDIGVYKYPGFEAEVAASAE